MTPDKAQLPPKLATNSARISLIGCGGNGSAMLLGLARLNHALSSLGHPGFSVDVYDGDTVAESNVGRQCFFAPDIGLPKASTLVQRLNLSFGTRWTAHDEYFDGSRLYSNLVIAAVDSVASRRLIDEATIGTNSILLDLGNGPSFGQVVIGGFDSLVSPYLALPDLVDPTLEKPKMPSCSSTEALTRQELFVNTMAVTLASQLLWELFRTGSITKAGFYFNLDKGTTKPISVKSITSRFSPYSKNNI